MKLGISRRCFRDSKCINSVSCFSSSPKTVIRSFTSSLVDHSPPPLTTGLKRILLVRHAESMGNADQNMFFHIADHAIPLSKRGITQAQRCGQTIADFYKKNSEHKDFQNKYCRMLVSPFLRTRQTAEEIIKGPASEYINQYVESPLLVEQDFGLFEGLNPSQWSELWPKEYEKYQFRRKFGGTFYARFPLGESRVDVCLRVTQLFHRILRDSDVRPGQTVPPLTDVIVVSHGVAARAFAMMWLQRPPEWFEGEPNPQYASIRLIEKTTDRGYIFNGFGEDGKPVDG